MFIAIYTFKPKPGQEQEFEEAWAERTIEIRETMHSLGSRLHRADDGTYVGYAQWKSKEHWESMSSPIDTAARKRLMDACQEVTTIFKLDVINDLLIKEK